MLRLLLPVVLLAAAPVTPGTITVEPLPADAGPEGARQAFAGAVATALLDAGFLSLPHGQGRYVARLTLVRTPKGQVATPGAKSGSALGLGNWGTALSIGLPTKKTQLSTLFVTELTVEIVARTGGAALWHGRAVAVRSEGSAGDAPAVLARDLARAALSAFPAQSEQVVAVP